MSTFSSLTIEFGADINQLQSGLKKAENQTEAAARRLQRQAKKIADAYAAIGASQSEKDMRRVNQTIDSAKATPEQADELRKMQQLTTAKRLAYEAEQKIQAQAAQRRINIQRIISALEKEAAAIGKTNAQLSLEQLRANGASEAQIKHAQVLQRISASKKLAYEAEQKIQAQEAQRIAGIQQTIGALEREAAAIGKTNAQLSVEQLRAKGASQAQIKHAQALQQNIDKYKKSQASMRGFIGQLKTVGVALLGVGGAAATTRAADEWTQFSNRIKLVSANSDEVATAQQRLLDIANKSGQSIDATGQLYQRFAMSQKELKLSQKELLDVTESVNTAMMISGASGQSAEAAMIQFSQGLGAGVLRGQEFNSVMEQAPALAEYMAKGLGVTRSQLRLLANEGYLTSDVIVRAMQKMDGTIKNDAKGWTLTIGQSIQQLRNQFAQFVGQTGEASGVIQAFSGTIRFVARNIDFLAGALGALLAVKVVQFIYQTVAAVAAATVAVAKKTKNIIADTLALNANSAALARNTTAQVANAAAAATGGVARRGQGAVPQVRRLKPTSAGFLSSTIMGFRVGLMGVAGTFITALSAGLTGIQATFNAAMGKSADNWISRMGDGALKMVGILQNDESLGTYLYNRTHEILPSATGNYNEQFRLSGLFFDNYLEQHRKLATEAQERADKEKKIAEDNQFEVLKSAGAIRQLADETEKQVQAVGKSKEQLTIWTAELSLSAAKKANANPTEIAEMQGNIDKAKQNIAKKKELESQEAINQIIDGFKKEAQTLGMSNEALLQHKLSLEGATEEQKKEAIERMRLVSALQREMTLKERIDSLNSQALRIGKSEREVKIMDLKDEGYNDTQIKQYLEAFDKVQLLKASENFNQAVDKFSNAGKPNETGDEVRARAKAEFEAQIAKYMQPAKLPTYGGVQDTSLASKIASSNEALAELNRKIIERDEQKRLNALNGVPQVQPPAIEKQNMGEITLNLQTGDSKQLTGKLFGNMDFINKLKNVTKMTVDDMINDKARAMVN